MAKSTKHINEPEVSRRDLFHIMGTVPAVAVATGSAFAQEAHEHKAQDHSGTAAPKGPFQRRIFNEEQFRTVGVLADLILPADERTGSATDAKVPEFMDDWIAFRREQDDSFALQAQICGGLTWLDTESTRLFEKNFADASVAQQKQLLDRIAWPARASEDDYRWVMFFNKFRDLTLTGFYSSKMGIADLQYKGNVAVMRWEGCPPQVWATLQERMKNGYKGVSMQEMKPFDQL